jgi:uracil-DNA glycosylase family 4
MRTTLKHPKTFCEGCSLNKTRNKLSHYIPTDVYYNQVNDEGKPQVDLLIVGDPPGKAEDESSMPFTGAAGFEIKQALVDGNITSYAIAHSVRCRPVGPDGKNRAPTAEEAAACSNYIKQDLVQLRPKVVLLLSNIAKDVIAPKEWKSIGINKLRGDILTTEGTTYTATVNPNQFIRSNNYLEKQQFYRHVANTKRLITGEHSAYSRKGITQVLKTEEDVFKFINILETVPSEYVFVDTETENLNRVAPNKVATIQFAMDNEVGYVIPIDHWQSPFSPEATERIVSRLGQLFSNPDLPFECWCAHGTKFDYNKICRRFNIHRTGKPFLDTIMLEYLRDENQRRGADDDEGGGGQEGAGVAFDLKSMAKDKLCFRHYKSEMLEARKSGSFIEEPLWLDNGKISDFSDYAGMDVYVGRRLLCYILEDLEKTGHKQKSWNFAIKWSFRVTHLLSKIEINGAFADKDHLDYLQSEYSPILTRMLEIPQDIMESPEGKKANALLLETGNKTKGFRPLFGKQPTVFSIDKKDHRIALLVNTCKLEPVSYGKLKDENGKEIRARRGEVDKGNGIASIDKAFYAQHKGNYFSDIIQEYEGLKKLKSSYLDSVRSFLTDEFIQTKRGLQSNADNLFDGRIHATFWDSRTVTGRLASSAPNMQQQPRSDTFAKAMIKSLYGAAPGHFILEADYGQAEVRWWAQIAKDKEYAALFWNMYHIIQEYEANPTPELKLRVENECDIHKQVSSAMNRIPITEVTKEQRQAAKGLCVAKGTLIRTEEGLIPIEEAIENWKGELKLETRAGVETANKAYEITVDKTIKVTSGRGFELEGRPEHPILAWRDCKLQYVELQDLQETDNIVIRREAKLWPTREIPLVPYVRERNGGQGSEPYPCSMPEFLDGDLARLIGYITSEGFSNAERTISISNTDRRIIEDIRYILTSKFGTTGYSEFVNNKDRIEIQGHKPCTCFSINASASRFLRLNNLVGFETSYTKYVSPAILKSPKNVIIEFLRGYIAGDGSSDKRQIKVTSASEQLMKEIQILFIDLGLISSRRSEYVVTNKGEGLYWNVTLVGKEVDTAWILIPPIRPLKIPTPKKFNNSNLDKIFGLHDKIKEIRKDNQHVAGNQHKGHWQYPGFPWTGAKELTIGFYRTHREQITKGLLARGKTELVADINEILDQGYFLDTLKHKEEKTTKGQVVYDFTVPGSHSFVTQSFLSRNTFGVIFGMVAKSLSVLIKCSEQEAQKLMNDLTNRFERAGGWLTYIEEFAIDNGYVMSPYGRVRHLAHLAGDQEHLLRRLARNSPIQGAASDTTALAAWTLQDWIERNNKPYKIWNVVHDAIYTEAPLTMEALQECISQTKRCMTQIGGLLKDDFGIDLIVPLVVDFKVGLRGGSCKTIDAETNLEDFLKNLQAQDRRMHNGDKWWQIATELEIKSLQKEMSKVEKDKKDGFEAKLKKISLQIEHHKQNLERAK